MKKSIVLGVALGLCASSVWAQDNVSNGGQASWKPQLNLGGAAQKIKMHGFVSAGLSAASDAAGYGIPNFGTVKKKYNFAPNSLAGLQFSANITPKLSAVIQLVANGSTRDGNKAYNIRSEWAFVRYKFQNNWQARAGRFRLPSFLYSDTAEVGYSYPWVWLPNEVYRIVPFDNFNAVDVSFSQALGGSGWTAKVEPFIGSNQSDFDIYNNAMSSLPAPKYNTLKFHEDNIMGGVVSVSNAYVTLRAAYIHIKATAYLGDHPLLPGGSAPMPVPGSGIGPDGQLGAANQPAYFYTFAGRVNYKNFLGIAEYAHRRAFPGVASLTGYYATLGYRLAKVLPSITYARLKTTNLSDLNGAFAPVSNPFSESPQSQRSWSLGLDYYFNSNLVFKGAVYQITPMDGTNGLFDYPVTHKHVYLYALGLSAIF